MKSQRAFLAFDTGRGLAYAHTSGWQRSYLLWTFRNFRGVPHKILNARQRQLVDGLYAASSTSLSSPPDEFSLIGTIEDFSPATAVASVTGTRNDAAPFIPATEATETLSVNLSEQLHAINAHRITPSLLRTVGAWAVVAVMAFLSWQQWRTRPVVASTQFAAAASPVSAGDGLRAAPANVGAATIPAPAFPKPDVKLAGVAEAAMAAPVTPSVRAVATTDTLANQSASDAKHEERSANKGGAIQIASSVPRMIASLTASQEGFASSPRMRISGPPQKLVYPVCPDGSTGGKVSLQAVVGYDGAVSQVKVLAGNRRLAAAAARAIREWRYQPSSGDAPKLERETSITISFISDDVVGVSFPDAPVSK